MQATVTGFMSLDYGRYKLLQAVLLSFDYRESLHARDTAHRQVLDLIRF
jgi:hypothetical protein